MRAGIIMAATLLAGTASVAMELLGDAAPPRQVESGRAVAAGAGGQGQQGACFSCHGFDGAARPAAAFPALAGQSAEYLHAQLERYASGERANPIMGPIAAAMTPAQRRDVAVYYAAQPVVPGRGDAQADPALVQHGGILSASGSAESGLQACQNCHGPAGIGIGSLYPRLAGQPARYIEAQLRAWQSGDRAADAPRETMASIARRMSDRDIRGAAAYFASVRQEAAPMALGVLP